MKNFIFFQMGCCFSSNKTRKSSSKTRNQRHSIVGHSSRSDFSNAIENRIPPPPPPPPLEEESVKEVLSETPTAKPPPPPPPQSLPPPPPPPIEEEKKKIPIHQTEEISEVSDICSFSESLSTITEKIDDYEEIRQRVCRSPAKLPKKNRSLSDDWSVKREKMVGKSPTRKSDHSPSRRNVAGGGCGVGNVKSGQNRDMGRQQQIRNENSRRRSRSPATTRTAVGRSPSVRRSPGREETTRKESRQKEAAKNDTPEGKWSMTNESLENPLVSLECFIFL